MENVTNDANVYTMEEIYDSYRANPETGLMTEYNDEKHAANKDHLTPPQAAEGGANLQVKLPI